MSAFGTIFGGMASAATGMGDCSDAYNIMHRWMYGTDSPCKQKELEDALVKAGEERSRARQQVAQHQEQMKSTTVVEDFIDAGKKGLFALLFGVGVALVVYYALEYGGKKR